MLVAPATYVAAFNDRQERCPVDRANRVVPPALQRSHEIRAMQVDDRFGDHQAQVKLLNGGQLCRLCRSRRRLRLTWRVWCRSHLSISGLSRIAVSASVYCDGKASTAARHRNGLEMPRSKAHLRSERHWTIQSIGLTFGHAPQGRLRMEEAGEQESGATPCND
jgi:hypothetical protein